MAWYGTAGPEQVREEQVLKAAAGAAPRGGGNYPDKGMLAPVPIIDAGYSTNDQFISGQNPA